MRNPKGKKKGAWYTEGSRQTVDRWTGKQKTVKVEGMQIQNQAGDIQLGTMTSVTAEGSRR